MRKSGVGITVTAIVAVVVACAPGPVSPPTSTSVATAGTARKLTEYLGDLVRSRQFRGAVEVRLGDEVLLSRGFGHADVARDVPNETDTRFRIASLTKQFTALAVLSLQEQAKLKVTDLVCTHLTGCPAAWRAITIEHLLTHTAGLFNLTELDAATTDRYVAEFGTRPTPEQLIQTFVDLPLDFPPGSNWHYSNSGYVLLGHLVERLSGHTYAQFLDDRILGPLGMSDTAYDPDHEGTEHDAVGYRNWTTPGDTDIDAYAFASGGIRSTVTDLARWNQFLLTGTPAIVDQDTLAQFLRPRVPTGRGERYGYGIHTRGTGNSTTHFHNGDMTGFHSYSEIQPATELSIVVLSNIDVVNLSRIGRNLATLATT
jgi:CubicO group peptidase (beta-lactamase class C family)